jgi:DNA-directed RNA polymerase subunit RPC12/RpoP
VTSLRGHISIGCNRFRKERFSIFESVGTSPAGEAFATGSMPGEGTYFCLVCGTQLALRETDPLPECPACGTSRFRRDSIFIGLQEHGSPILEFAVSGQPEPQGWLEQAREHLTAPGYHLAMRDRDEVKTFHLKVGWTRIGRCDRAEICLDDPSVSRRHAMIATDEGRPPRILDDRSLNGLLVNGRKVDWTELSDGDELTIGRYRLFLLQA